MNCSTCVVGLDAQILHQTSHAGDAASASITSDLARYLPDACVDDADLQPVDDCGRTQRDDAFGPVAVAMFDGVGDGFAGSDEHVLNLIALDPSLGQPAAQGSTAWSQVPGVGGEVHLQWGGLPVQQH